MTPGPWKTGGGYRAASIPIVAGNKTIAAVRTKFNGYNVTPSSYAEGAHNARIIAALPALLDALLHARSFVDVENAGESYTQELLDKIDAALAQAGLEP